MELLGVRGILIAITLVAVSIHVIVWISSYFKINLASIMLVLYIVVNTLYYFSPQLLSYIWYLQESSHPKIVQLQPYFSTIEFKVIEAGHHNAVGLGFGSNRLIGLTSKTVEESTLGELIGVSYHELGHIQERHTSSMTLVMILLYYLLTLFYKTVKWSQNRKIYTMLLLSLVWVLAYLALSRVKEHHADIYAKESWNWLGLAMYFERVISNNPDHTGVEREWFEALWYLHPPLAERIKFLTNK